MRPLRCTLHLEKISIKKSVISLLWQRFQVDSNASRRYSTGFPLVTSPNEDRYLEVTAKTNRLTTASDQSQSALFSRSLQRLVWSGEHALLTSQQWSCVMFSDESRFNLQSDSRQSFIWRAPSTRYHQESITERHNFGGAGLLVWVWGIILDCKTDLHVQIGAMTGQIYWDIILVHVRHGRRICVYG
ncbi:transposable element Tcb1 transposase [Trichonephila clavipes]|nr:transposable element Tcb1 transposase [Trichonephila clavipes]